MIFREGEDEEITNGDIEIAVEIASSSNTPIAIDEDEGNNDYGETDAKNIPDPEYRVLLHQSFAQRILKPRFESLGELSEAYRTELQPSCSHDSKLGRKFSGRLELDERVRDLVAQDLNCGCTYVPNEKRYPPETGEPSFYVLSRRGVIFEDVERVEPARRARPASSGRPCVRRPSR